MAEQKLTDRITTVVITIVVAGVLGVIGTALAGGALIGALGGVTEKDLEDAIKELGEPGAPAGISSGAVIAFDLPTGCPDGWSAFRDADGRTVIGAGAGMIPGTNERDESIQTKKYRQHGGEEEVTLTVDEIPKHFHKYSAWANIDDVKVGRTVVGYDKEILTKDTPSNVHKDDHKVLNTASVGEERPINNMPPYIALYFCKKD